MKRPIQSRITTVLIVSILLIAVMGVLSLYYFSQISGDIDQIIKSDIIAERSAQKMEGMFLDLKMLIANAHRNMLLVLFICLAGGLILVFLAPRRVTAPFRRYIDAVKEVEELKFDTKLPIKGDDEVAELGTSINNLIDRFCTFDEMKQKRIQFEKSKQRVLANMLDQGVMMIAIEGDILFLNAQLAKILDLDTESYQGKDHHVVSIPEELKEMIAEVLKKKEKIDSRMMIFHYKEKGEKEKKAVEVLVDAGLVRNFKGLVVNIIITFEDITNPPGSSVFKRISITEQALV